MNEIDREYLAGAAIHNGLRLRIFSFGTSRWGDTGAPIKREERGNEYFYDEPSSESLPLNTFGIGVRPTRAGAMTRAMRRALVRAMADPRTPEWVSVQPRELARIAEMFGIPEHQRGAYLPVFLNWKTPALAEFLRHDFEVMSWLDEPERTSFCLLRTEDLRNMRHARIRCVLRGLHHEFPSVVVGRVVQRLGDGRIIVADELA